jgi:N-acetyl-gamma-glutamyl-phosphate reductase
VPVDAAKTIGIVGASGYAGQVLHALLMRHPCIRPRVVEGREPAGPGLDACRECDAVALAVPDDAARAWASALGEIGCRVLDLSGVHRLDPAIHYGLPELEGAPPDGARLVANPGCYPTAALLCLAPLRRAGVIDDEPIAIVGASGTSGAGRGLREDLHFSELFANTFPYNVGRHKHIPEIERVLGTPVSFVTQLIPIVRGLQITAHVRPRGEPALLLDALRRFAEPHPYITVLPEPGHGLGVRHVVGTHQAVLAVGPSARGGVVPVFASIDNLMRGAASQALHNLNLWLGLPAHMGLPEPLAHVPDGVPGMKTMPT